ncbi:glycosyltransferase [Streptomyces sioyaensis]|uniref:WXG100-like domain-containing protein n=1 Tax=Streptomyces sioyaensis TaxID=67364 RepID=UPI00379D20D6
MGIQIPPEIAWAVSWAAGGDWPKPDEDHVRAIGAVWNGVSQELDRVAAEVDPVTARVLGSVKGAAATAFGSFASRLRQTIPSMAGAAGDIGTMSVNTALQVEYAKYMILAQSAWLAAEIVALASSFYGSALIPAEITAVRINVQLILRRAFKAVVSAAVTQAAMDAAVQGIQFLKGDRTEWDVKGTALGAAMGGMGGAIGMPISLAGSALAPKLSHTIVGHAVTGAVSGVAVGAATNLAFNAGQDLGLAAGAGAIGGAAGWRHRPGGTSPTGVENVEGVPEAPKLSQDVTGEVATLGHTTDGASTGHPSEEPVPTEAAPQADAASTTGTTPADGTESPQGERQSAEAPSTASQPTRTEPGGDAPVSGSAQAPDAAGTHAPETERAQTAQDARAATSTALTATTPLPLDGSAGATGRTTPTASADTQARSTMTTGEGHGNSGSQQRDETTTAATTATATRPETRAATSPETASQTTAGGIETERGAATTAPATATRASGPATDQPEQHAAATASAAAVVPTMSPGHAETPVTVGSHTEAPSTVGSHADTPATPEHQAPTTAPATSTASTSSATVEASTVEAASSSTVASQASPSVPHSVPEHATGLPGMDPAAKAAEQPASPHLADTVVRSGTQAVEHGPSTVPETPSATHADPVTVVPAAHQLGKAAGEPPPGLPGLDAKGTSTQAVQPERAPTQAVRAVAEPPVGGTPVRLSSTGTGAARPLPTVAAHDPAAHSPLRTAGGPPRTGEPATASHGATSNAAAEPRTPTSAASPPQPTHPPAAAEPARHAVPRPASSEPGTEGSAAHAHPSTDSNGQPVHGEPPQGSHHDDRRDPPDGGGDPLPPHPRSDDTTAAHPSSSRLPEYIPAPEHAQASPEQQRHWEQAQRELHGAYDTHLTEAARVADEQAEVRERLDAAFTQWSQRLPEHSPEEFAVAVRLRAEEVVRAELTAQPESRERILGDLHGRLELAAVREAAVRVGMERFERTVDVASRQLAAPGEEFGPQPALSREMVGRAREHLSGVFRDRVEKAVAEAYRTPDDVGEALPERTVHGEGALDGLTAALPRDLDLRVGFETALDSADRAVAHTAGAWRDGLDAAGERLLEQTGVAADAGVSQESLRLLRTTLREQVESDFTAVFSSVDSADDFHGSPRGAVADFNGRFEQRLEELPRQFAVQAAREGAIRTVLDTVHEAAGVWHEQGLPHLDKATAETFGLSGPVPEHLADRVAVEMARGVDGRLLRTRDAEMDTWGKRFGELTASDRIHDLITLHSAREHGFRAAEGQAHERVAAWREDHILSDDAAERVREGHSERVREAFDELFPTPDALRGDGVAQRLQRWRETRQALDDDLAVHLAFESEVMPALEGAARGFDALAADKGPLPFAELSDLKERYGDEWFTAYREHWGPERLDADKWLAHEAAHESTFRAADGDEPAERGGAQSLSPLDGGRARTDGHSEHTGDAVPADSLDRWSTSRAFEQPGAGDAEVFPELPAKYAGSGLEETFDGKPVGDRIPNPHYQPLTAEERAAHRPQPGPPEHPATLAPVTPGDRVAHVAAPDTWTHRSDNAPSALLRSERFDPASNPLDPSRFPGTLSGAQTLIRAQVSRIQAENGTWVRDHTVTLPLRLDHTVTPHDLTTLNTRLQESLDAHVNTGYALPRSGDQLHVTLHLVHDDHHPEHILLSRTPTPTDQRHWNLPQDRNDTAPLPKFTHEVLHYLGLPDEYLKENFLFRLDKDRPAVHSDDALMVQADRFTPLPERYLTVIENTVDANTVLRDHPLPPRRENDPVQRNHDPATDPTTDRWPTSRSPDPEEDSSGRSQHSAEQLPTETQAIGIRKDPFGGWRLDDGTPLTVDDRSGLMSFVEQALRPDAPTGERLQARILLRRLEQLSLGKHPTDPITERISPEQLTALGEVHQEVRQYYETALASASPVSDGVLVPKKVHFVWFGKPMSPHGMANVLRWADHISRANGKLPPGRQWELNLWTDPKYNAKGSKNAWQTDTEKLRKAGVTVHTDTAEKVAGAARSVQERHRQLDPDGSQGLTGLPDLSQIYRAGLKEGAFNLGSDIARYAVLAEQGGVYADVDLGPGHVSFETIPDIRMRRDDVPLLSPGLRDRSSLLKELRELGRRAQTGSSDSGGPITQEELLAAAKSRYEKGHLGNHFIVAPPHSDFINMLNEKIPQEFQKIGNSSSKNGPDLTREAAAISGPGLIHFVRLNQRGSALGEYVGDVLGLWRGEPAADLLTPPGLRSRDLVALFDPQLLTTWEGLEWVTEESAHQLDPVQQPVPADAPTTATSGALPTPDAGTMPTDIRDAGDSEIIDRWRTLSALPRARRSDALRAIDTAVDAWANGGRRLRGDHETNQRQLGAILDAVKAWRLDKNGPSARIEAVGRLTAHVQSARDDLDRRIAEQAQAEGPSVRERGGTDVRPHAVPDPDGGSTPHDADRWPTSHAPEGSTRSDVSPAGESPALPTSVPVPFAERSKRVEGAGKQAIDQLASVLAEQGLERWRSGHALPVVDVVGYGNGKRLGGNEAEWQARRTGAQRAEAAVEALRAALAERLPALQSEDGPRLLARRFTLGERSAGSQLAQQDGAGESEGQARTLRRRAVVSVDYDPRQVVLASPGEHRESVPRAVHFVWLGGELTRGARANVEEWIGRTSDAGWQLNMWADSGSRDANEEFFQQIQELGGQIRDVDEGLFTAADGHSGESLTPGGDNALALFELAGQSRAHAMASDIARYALLYREGGVYLDVDLAPGQVQLPTEGLAMSSDGVPFFPPAIRNRRQFDWIVGQINRVRQQEGLPVVQPLPGEDLREVIEKQYSSGDIGNNLIVAPPTSSFLRRVLTHLPDGRDPHQVLANKNLKEEAASVTGPWLIKHQIESVLKESGQWPENARWADAFSSGRLRFDDGQRDLWDSLGWLTEESEHQETHQPDEPMVEQSAAGPSVGMAPLHVPEAPSDAPALSRPARQVPLPADPSTWVERRKEVPEGHVGHLRVERFDPAVDAMSRHRAPGTLAGAQTLMRSEVSRIQAENGTWVRDHVVTLPVRLAGSGLSEHDLAGLQTGFQGALDEHINQVGYALPRSGDQFHVELRLVHDDGHPEHVIVSRSANPGRSDQRHWNLGPPTEDHRYLPVLFHEVFHYLGLPDEYRDPEFLFRRNADSVAVRTDGLMADTARLAPLPERYLAAIEDTVDAGVVLHGYALRDPAADRDRPGAGASTHHDGWLSGVDWESERWDTAPSPRPDGDDPTHSAHSVATTDLSLPSAEAGPDRWQTSQSPLAHTAETDRSERLPQASRESDQRSTTEHSDGPEPASGDAEEADSYVGTPATDSDGESMHAADSAPGPVAPQSSERRHPWYVDHGAHGEIDVAGAATWDPERVGTEAAAVAGALTGLPGSPRHQQELRAGIERELRELFAADSGEQWSERLRAGHMAEVAGQTVWLRPVLREVTPADGSPHPDGAVQHQVYYGSAKVSSGAERETRSALNAALTTVLTVGATGLSTVAGPVPQLSVGGNTKGSHTDGFEVVSGRKPKTTGSTDFAAQVHVEVSVDGEVAPHNTVTPRGLTVRFPEVFSSAQEPRPDAVAHPMRRVLFPDAPHLTRAPLTLQAVDMGPVVVGLVRELRRAGIPADTVAVLMPKFIVELANEDIVRTRSRFWMTTGDSSGRFDENISAMKRFTGRFTASTVWERAQYVGTTAVRIQEDLALVTNDKHGRATTGESRIGGGIDVLGMSATDNGHLGNLSVGASAESSRTVSLAVNSGRAEYTVLTRHEDHARYHVQARVEVVTHSETHRDVRPVHATVATEILVPLRAAAEFERRMFGRVVTEAVRPGEPGTHPVGVDAIAPPPLASGRGQGFGKLIGLPGAERVYRELRQQLHSMMAELHRRPSPADRSRLETLLTTYYGRPALEGDLGVVLAGLDQRLTVGGESFDVSVRLHLGDRLAGTETYAMTMDGKAVSRAGMQAQRSHGIGLSASANGSAELKVSDRFKIRVGKFQVGGGWNRATGNTLSAESKNHRRTQTSGLVHELAYGAKWEVSVHHPKADAHWQIEDQGNLAAVFAVPDEHTPARDTPAGAADLSPSPAPAPAGEGYGAVRTLTDWPAAAHIPFEHHSGAVYPVFLHADELLQTGVEQYRRVNGILPGALRERWEFPLELRRNMNSSALHTEFDALASPDGWHVQLDTHKNWKQALRLRLRAYDPVHHGRPDVSIERALQVRDRTTDSSRSAYGWQLTGQLGVHVRHDTHEVLARVTASGSASKQHHHEAQHGAGGVTRATYAGPVHTYRSDVVVEVTAIRWKGGTTESKTTYLHITQGMDSLVPHRLVGDLGLAVPEHVQERMDGDDKTPAPRRGPHRLLGDGVTEVPLRRYREPTLGVLTGHVEQLRGAGVLTHIAQVLRERGLLPRDAVLRPHLRMQALRHRFSEEALAANLPALLGNGVHAWMPITGAFGQTRFISIRVTAKAFEAVEHWTRPETTLMLGGERSTALSDKQVAATDRKVTGEAEGRGSVGSVKFSGGGEAGWLSKSSDTRWISKNTKDVFRVKTREGSQEFTHPLRYRVEINVAAQGPHAVHWMGTRVRDGVLTLGSLSSRFLGTGNEVAAFWYSHQVGSWSSDSAAEGKVIDGSVRTLVPDHLTSAQPRAHVDPEAPLIDHQNTLGKRVHWHTGARPAPGPVETELAAHLLPKAVPASEAVARWAALTTLPPRQRPADLGLGGAWQVPGLGLDSKYGMRLRLSATDGVLRAHSGELLGHTHQLPLRDGGSVTVGLRVVWAQQVAEAQFKDRSYSEVEDLPLAFRTRARGWDVAGRPYASGPGAEGTELRGTGGLSYGRAHGTSEEDETRLDYENNSVSSRELRYYGFDVEAFLIGPYGTLAMEVPGGLYGMLPTEVAEGLHAAHPDLFHGPAPTAEAKGKAPEAAALDDLMAGWEPPAAGSSTAPVRHLADRLRDAGLAEGSSPLRLRAGDTAHAVDLARAAAQSLGRPIDLILDSGLEQRLVPDGTDRSGAATPTGSVGPPSGTAQDTDPTRSQAGAPAPVVTEVSAPETDPIS